jgi:SAM-dependent methyltransferase
MNRSTREKKAYDEGTVWEDSHAWHQRFQHVFDCPNTVHNESVFNDLIKKNIVGKKVLEIGCGTGTSSHNLSSLGADYVYGVDISEKAIEEANKIAIRGQLEFANKDISEHIDGSFDIIFGRAILHHLDYRAVLTRLYQSNLKAEGYMIFMEPLGSNLLIKLYHAISRSAHTPDERPFYRKNLKWLRKTFQNLQIIPINYLSFPFGLISTSLFSRADNALMQLCNKVDCWIAKNIKLLIPNFRYAIFVVKK